MIRVAIVDIIGLTYDGSTLENYGLGGSESAIIYMAKELQKIGFDVTVFNNCIDSRAQEGVYDGVKYFDLRRLHEENSYICDILISSRTIIPFLPEEHWGKFNYPHPHNIFTRLKESAKHKVLWLHDTFCSGDHLIEELVTNNYIDEIFTLSDFHTAYITNCDHGRRRNFEVLKNKVFVTRNGAKKWISEVDITKKDPNHFVYNAAVNKGMLPLLEKIWPKIKHHIPQARLTVIGGYYRFRDGAPPDEQENKFHEIISRPEFNNLDITFTGVIPQKDVAECLANASFMLFPGAFPETFGISSLESLLYNTPIIATRFGALEETAIDMACYKINYAIEPNVLFRDIDTDKQTNIFVKTAVLAHHNSYLHQQKMHYCNIVHDIAGWDTVALQWKQHFYKKLDKFLPVSEFRQVTKINQKVHEVFQRRFSNQTEWNTPRSYPQQKIVVIAPFYNAEKYLPDCIMSVATQDYDNYEMYMIDDASTDSSHSVVFSTINQLPENIRSKFHVIRNEQNRGAVYNQITTLRKLNDEDIVMLIDGDDHLIADNNIFHYYNNLYDGATEFTYGSCWSQVDHIPLVAQEYPQHVKNAKSYRSHIFNWGIPYTHLRTFKKYLINQIPDREFQNSEGDWFKAGGDNATFYNIIEKADPTKVKAVQKIVYSYNDINPLNDYKVNNMEQNKNSAEIRDKKYPKNLAQLLLHKQKKNVLIAIPTNKYIEPETFKSIYDLQIPNNVYTTFQYFYGYQIDQIRNLIANWAINFDYLLSVDSDIVLPKDTLVKMIAHDVDMVSGVYIQRKPDVEILEIYRNNSLGGLSNVSYTELQPPGLHEIDGCGFGCVLVKSDLIRKIGYPQFHYHAALTHDKTFSEDLDFCQKAKKHNARIFVDSSIVCDHIGTTVYKPTLR